MPQLNKMKKSQRNSYYFYIYLRIFLMSFVAEIITVIYRGFMLGSYSLWLHSTLVKLLWTHWRIFTILPKLLKLIIESEDFVSIDGLAYFPSFCHELSNRGLPEATTTYHYFG